MTKSRYHHLSAKKPMTVGEKAKQIRTAWMKEHSHP